MLVQPTYQPEPFSRCKLNHATGSARAYWNSQFEFGRLALCGSADPRAELMQDQTQYFTGEYRFELVPGAGHFLHRERPEDVNRLILNWLAPTSLP